MTRLQPISSDSFDSDDKHERYPPPRVAQAVLLQQRPTSTASGTPLACADSPSESIASQSIPSLVHEGSTPSRSNVQIGSPAAVALKLQRSSSQIATPFPIRTHHRQRSKLSASFTFSSPLSSLAQRGDSTEAKLEDMSASDSEEDSEREEARLLLNLTRAQHQVRQLEQSVICAQIAENAAVGELYKFRASRAQRKLDTTEYDLGCLRNAIRKNGISMADLLTTRDVKRRRLSIESIIANEIPPSA